MTTTYISPELDAKVKAKMEWCRQIVLEKSGQNIVPILSYDVRGRVAGRGGLRPGKIPMVRFNPILLKENEQDMIENTVPHEFAHAVQYAVYGRIPGNTPHGPFWKRIMSWFGIYNPDRTHSYDVTNATVKHHKKIDFHCKCRIVPMGKNRAHKIITGKKKYYCLKCDYWIVPMDQIPSSRRAVSRIVVKMPVVTFSAPPVPTVTPTFKPTIKTIYDATTMTLRNVPA